MSTGARYYVWAFLILISTAASHRTLSAQTAASSPPPAVEGRVFAIAAEDPNEGNVIYVGGNFRVGEGVSQIQNLARWDGRSGQWSAVGSGLQGTVFALAVKDGQLYAGGDFTSTGDRVPVNYVARWNGSQWHPLAEGALRPVFALVPNPIGKGIYLGGQEGVSFYDESSIRPLPQGPTNGARAAATIDGALYVASDGVLWKYSPLQDPRRWETVPGVAPSAVTADGSRVIAAGAFNEWNRSGLGLWDGSAWSPVDAAGPLAGNVSNRSIAALAIGPNGWICAGGFFYLDQPDSNMDHFTCFDGQRWDSLQSRLGTNATDVVQTILNTPAGLYIGGTFTAAGGTPGANTIALWNGKVWNALTPGIPVSSATATPSPTPSATLSPAATATPVLTPTAPPSSAPSNNGQFQITGVIVDIHNTPIAGCKITLDGCVSGETVTDAKGVFSFSGPAKPGTAVIIPSAPNYVFSTSVYSVQIQAVQVTQTQTINNVSITGAPSVQAAQYGIEGIKTQRSVRAIRIVIKSPAAPDGSPVVVVLKGTKDAARDRVVAQTQMRNGRGRVRLRRSDVKGGKYLMVYLNGSSRRIRIR